MLKVVLIALLIIAAFVGGWVGLIYLFEPEFGRNWLIVGIFLAVLAFGELWYDHWNSFDDKVAKLKCLVYVIIPQTIFRVFGVFLIGPAFLGIIMILGGIIQGIGLTLLWLIGEVLRGIFGLG